MRRNSTWGKLRVLGRTNLILEPGRIFKQKMMIPKSREKDKKVLKDENVRKRVEVYIRQSKYLVRKDLESRNILEVSRKHCPPKRGKSGKDIPDF